MQRWVEAQRVYINVLDVNDNAPQLERALYSVAVSEDVDVGAKLDTIVAKDADMGKALVGTTFDCYRQSCF